MPCLIIRETVEDDIRELAQLYGQFWNEHSYVEKMQSKINEFRKAGTHVLLSAEEKGRIIGSVMGVICGDLYGACEPFMVMENMVVDRKYRNNGVGKALISELERIALEKKCTQIICVTESNRSDACKFYESVGYDPDAHKGFKKKLK